MKDLIRSLKPIAPKNRHGIPTMSRKSKTRIRGTKVHDNPAGKEPKAA